MVERDDIRAAIQRALDEAPERDFPESVELAINLKNVVDLSVPKNRIDEEIALPNGRGKDAKVGVFASGETAVKARESADLVVQPEEIEDLADDKREARKMAKAHDFFIAEAPMMPTIGRTLGTVLGPRGKMPRPIPPGSDPADQVNNLRSTVRVRSRDKRTFHTRIGTADMSVEDLTENANSVLRRVTRNLERGELYLGPVYVKTTMGPSQRIK